MSGRHEELAVAEADHDRRAVADRDDLLRIVGRDQHEREQAAHPRERAARGALEAAVRRHRLQFLLHQVRDDLGVRLGDELVALALQLVLQVEVVLDDAVVDDDDLARAVAVRVGVLLGGPAVRGPPRVADAVLAFEWLRPDDILEAGQLAGAAPQIDRAVPHHRDARRVVAAILEPPQAVDEDRDNFFGSDVTDDAAHRRLPLRLLFGLLLHFLQRRPAFLVLLPAACDAERAGRNVLGDRRAGRHVCPRPMVTGAINCVSLPMKAPSSITVWFLLTPS